MTLRESVSARTKNIDRDVELAKIHIFSERAHARYSTVVSTSFAVYVGFLVVFWTLFSENVLPLAAFSIGIIVLSAGTMYEIYRTRRTFDKQIKKISDMIETVKKGKELPSLEQLAKGRD